MVTSMQQTQSHTKVDKQYILGLLKEVCDPEIPVLSIADLGIIRNIRFDPSLNLAGGWEITITPTYSGCPAMDVIAMNIRFTLLEKGIVHFHIKQQLSPAWTTDWMTVDGKQKLKAYGIAPPGERIKSILFASSAVVQCPHCSSPNTTMLSEFGSTACKSLYTCNE